MCIRKIHWIFMHFTPWVNFRIKIPYSHLMTMMCGNFIIIITIPIYEENIGLLCPGIIALLYSWLFSSLSDNSEGPNLFSVDYWCGWTIIIIIIMTMVIIIMIIIILIYLFESASSRRPSWTNMIMIIINITIIIFMIMIIMIITILINLFESAIGKRPPWTPLQPEH